MSNFSGPPNQPPYGPPPYGAGPMPGQPWPPEPRRSSSATAVTALLAVLFVAATALAAWAVHDQDAKSTPSATVNGRSGVPQPATSGGIPAAGGASSTALPSTTLLPTPSTSAYTPSPTPTHQPLDPEAINRTFQVYMNALLNRSLSQLKLATCPKLRHTETGTALDGKYINRWKGHRYTIYDNYDYVTIYATVRYVNPNTGGNGGTHVYSWYVTRYPNGRYWVCGFRG